MAVVDRVVLRIYSALVLLGLLWAVLFVSGTSEVVYAASTTAAVEATWTYVAVVAILSFRYLFLRLVPRSIHSFVKDTEVGEIRISHETVRELAHRAARQVKGVERLSARVDEAPEGLMVSLRVRVLPHVDVTAMSDQLQRAVIGSIRDATSLAVLAVHVQVAGLAPETSQR